MKTEKIQRSTDSQTRETNTMIVLSTDEGKKLINQDYIDYKEGKTTEMPSLLICSQIYLGANDSALNYAEIDEQTATEYQEEYDKLMEEKLKEEIPNGYDVQPE